MLCSGDGKQKSSSLYKTFDRWGYIHARRLDPALYDSKLLKPSPAGIDYLLPIFTGAIGEDDMEHLRRTLFAQGNLAQPYHSINTDVQKRIRYLTEEDVLKDAEGI